MRFNEADMKKKIRFYKRLILETIEFMYFASAYMREMSRRNHISVGTHFSGIMYNLDNLRNELVDDIRDKQ